MKIKRLLFSLVLLFCFIGQSYAGPGFVPLFDNFNSENGGVGEVNYNSFANWNVVDGTVDLIGNGYFQLGIPSSYGLFIDMDGSSGNAGKLISKTAFTLDPGPYELKFDLAGNRRNNSPEKVIVQVAMGNLFNKTYSLLRNDPFTTFTENFDVTLSKNAQLSFEGVGGDNIGMLLDNVELTYVPEPGTLLLLGSGLLGLGVIGRIRRKKKA